MRIFKASHALFVLLAVTFGLFLASTFWHTAPAPEPSSDTIVTVFTDLPSQPDSPALGLSGAMLGLAILCGLFVLLSAASAALTTFALSRCLRVHDRAALLN